MCVCKLATLIPLFHFSEEKMLASGCIGAVGSRGSSSGWRCRGRCRMSVAARASKDVSIPVIVSRRAVLASTSSSAFLCLATQPASAGKLPGTLSLPTGPTLFHSKHNSFSLQTILWCPKAGSSTRTSRSVPGSLQRMETWSPLTGKDLLKVRPGSRKHVYGRWTQGA